MAPATVWAAHKATIRGQLIAIATALKKQRLKDLTEALATLKELETQHKQNPSDALLARLTTTRVLLKRLSTADVARNLMWTKQRFYEKGNKVDSLLANCLKKTAGQQQKISKIRPSKGEITNHPDEITHEFLHQSIQPHQIPTSNGRHHPTGAHHRLSAIPQPTHSTST
ncbi:endonuclease, partial, partial [Pelobates cultripes]